MKKNFYIIFCLLVLTSCNQEEKVTVKKVNEDAWHQYFLAQDGFLRNLHNRDSLMYYNAKCDVYSRIIKNTEQ